MNRNNTRVLVLYITDVHFTVIPNLLGNTDEYMTLNSKHNTVILR